jgi:hypothetical protein
MRDNPMTDEARNIGPEGFGAMRRLCAIIVVLAQLSPAYAQHGHERWHQYYRTWLQPGTTVSCCNARITQFGIESGDCEPTKYEMRNGDWYAWHRQQDKWIKVPDDRLLRERNPSGEEGHLCSVNHSGQWVILCAVPPDTGG